MIDGPTPRHVPSPARLRCPRPPGRAPEATQKTTPRAPSTTCDTGTSMLCSTIRPDNQALLLRRVARAYARHFPPKVLFLLTMSQAKSESTVAPATHPACQSLQVAPTNLHELLMVCARLFAPEVYASPERLVYSTEQACPARSSVLDSSGAENNQQQLASAALHPLGCSKSVSMSPC